VQHAASKINPVALAGRSIYYGALLYLSHLLGSFWFLAVFQAALVAIASTLTLASVSGLTDRSLRPGAATWMMAVLAIGSPVAVFAGFMMPDVFAGLAILAFANLMAF
jgi:hypothetical protein